MIERYRNSKETHLQQRCKEYLEIKAVHKSGQADIKGCLFTPHSEFKNTSYDYELNFLNDYVQEAINQGANPLNEDKRSQAISSTGTQDVVTEKELNFTPYEKPTRGAMNIKSQPRIEKTVPETNEPKLILKNTSKKGRWTKQGYVGPEEEKKIETKNKTFQKPQEEQKTEETRVSTVSSTASKKKETKQPEPPKKNKLAGALFAGVVKKNKDSDDSESDSGSSSDEDDDSDEEEKIKTKKKKGKAAKGKAKQHEVEDVMKEKSLSKKADVNELFDMGDSQDIDPYKMMSKETDDEILLGKDAPNTNGK